ncbi:MAG: UDP-N-acetylmuramate dehydrogenase [Lachnospiraceae bacterium]
MEEKNTRELFSLHLRLLAGETRVLEQEPMFKHTTFRVGGPADWFVLVDSVEILTQILALCRQYEMPWVILGNGSNVLVSDKGIRGVVLHLAGEFEELSLKEEVPEGVLNVTVGAAVPLSKLAYMVGKKGFTGLEFASGIPGTVGGAVWMNAGAYGGEIKDTLTGVTVLTKDGKTEERTAEELKLGYRCSALQESGELVLSARFRLYVRQRIQIYAIMESYKKARMLKQPLEYPSAGSTFKRPSGYYAGKLIEEAGLSGFRIGGAAVSEKHAGFVINKENATAADIYALICHVEKRVKETSGVTLEPEVRLLGEFV